MGEAKVHLSRHGEAVKEFSTSGLCPECFSQSPLYLGYPKFPSFRQQGRPVKTAINYGVKEMGNRCLTFRVTWREMFGQKGLKMRGREWM